MFNGAQRGFVFDLLCFSFFFVFFLVGQAKKLTQNWASRSTERDETRF